MSSFINRVFLFDDKVIILYNTNKRETKRLNKKECLEIINGKNIEEIKKTRLNKKSSNEYLVVAGRGFEFSSGYFLLCKKAAACGGRRSLFAPRDFLNTRYTLAKSGLIESKSGGSNPPPVYFRVTKKAPTILSMSFSVVAGRGFEFYSGYFLLCKKATACGGRRSLFAREFFLTPVIRWRKADL